MFVVFHVFLVQEETEPLLQWFRLVLVNHLVPLFLPKYFGCFGDFVVVDTIFEARGIGNKDLAGFT